MPRASFEPTVRRTVLRTPPASCIVPDRVFDAFGWCRSDTLEWRRPADRWDADVPIDGTDPERMVFVLRAPCPFLPCELAKLHAFGLGLSLEQALAPWGIDAATDGFHANATRPNDVLWLAADNANALFWGLHDWAHFHNHGPFVERAWTELQCDATALGWLWINRVEAGIADPAWERLRRDASALSRQRFAAEGLGFDSEALAAEKVWACVS